MASSKRLFGGRLYAGRLYAAALWRGTGPSGIQPGAATGHIAIDGLAGRIRIRGTPGTIVVEGSSGRIVINGGETMPGVFYIDQQNGVWWYELKDPVTKAAEDEATIAGKLIDKATGLDVVGSDFSLTVQDASKADYAGYSPALALTENQELILDLVATKAGPVTIGHRRVPVVAGYQGEV